MNVDLNIFSTPFACNDCSCITGTVVTTLPSLLSNAHFPWCSGAGTVLPKQVAGTFLYILLTLEVIFPIHSFHCPITAMVIVLFHLLLNTTQNFRFSLWMSPFLLDIPTILMPSGVPLLWLWIPGNIALFHPSNTEGEYACSSGLLLLAHTSVRLNFWVSAWKACEEAFSFRSRFSVMCPSLGFALGFTMLSKFP